MSSSDKQSIALLNTSSTSFFSCPEKETWKRKDNQKQKFTNKKSVRNSKWSGQSRFKITWNWQWRTHIGVNHPLFPNQTGIQKCWFL